MDYHGFIFTKHALERLKLRSVSQDDVISVLRHPEVTHPTDKQNTSKFIRTLRGRNIQVVATYLSDQKKWLIVSVWVRGEDDPIPLIWQLLTLPFKGILWLLKLIFKALFK